MKEIVDIVSKKQPEKVDKIKEMFNAYIMKSQMLQSYYGVKKEDRDKVAVEIMVINHLEAEITKLGGNLDEIRKEFNSNQ